MTDAKNIINHIGMVLDASGSMAGHTGDLVRVVDGQVTHYSATEGNRHRRERWR